MKLIIDEIERRTRGKAYWLLLLFTGLVLIAGALFYQHVLDELPCIVCIHVRLWVCAMIIVSLIGIFGHRIEALNNFLHLSMTGIAYALTDRSYQLLGTERGWIFGDCGFFLEVPEWFAVEQWVPWLFQVETSCGYTPELLFGVTMAEFLMVFSSVLLLMSVLVCLVRVRSIFHAKSD